MKPCANCPFRTDKPGFITSRRGEEIWESLEGGQIFPCHKTVDYSDETGDPREGRITDRSTFCVGSLVLMEREFPAGCSASQMVRISGRLGMLDLDAIDFDDESIATDLDSWLSHLEPVRPSVM